MTNQSASARTKTRSLAALQEALETSENNFELLQERLAELELAKDDIGWIRIGETGTELSRESITLAAHAARMSYLKNPLISRAVKIQAAYTFGQGVEIQARDDEVDEVVQAFIDHPRNQQEIFSHQARIQRDVELCLDGNLFLALLVDKADGTVHVRSFPLFEVEKIITNPDDMREVWYYRRTWDQKAWDYATGEATVERKTIYYPDWRYNPANKPGTLGGVKVDWGTKIYHVRTGGFSDWRFGLSEVYAAIDWAKAYKEFLEDWSTLVRAYSRFAWKMTTKGGKTGVAAAKAKLGRAAAGEGNTAPPPMVGSTFVGAEGVDFTPLKTSGATVSAEDGRRLLLMVAAGTGFPETFFGDVSVGTLATAESLDRPTELQMKNRQALWTAVYKDLTTFAIESSALSAGGALSKGSKVDQRGISFVVVELGGDKDPGVDIDFPSVVEQGTKDKIEAIISAATLDGKTLSSIPDMRFVTRLLLTALGVDELDTVLEDLFPKDIETNVLLKAEEPPADKNTEDDPNAPPKPDGDLPDPSEEETVDDEDAPEKPAAKQRQTEAYRRLAEASQIFIKKYGVTDAD